MTTERLPRKLIYESYEIPLHGHECPDTPQKLIAMLQDILAKVPEETVNGAELGVYGRNDEYGSDLHLTISWERMETDIEFKLRCAELELMLHMRRQRAIEAQRIAEENERAEYERLKAKFEGELT